MKWQTYMTSRWIFLTSLMTNLAVILAIVFFLFVLKLEPCPMCILQQVAIYMVTLVTIIALIRPLNWNTQVTFQSIIILLALLGLYVSTQQVWMQWHPEQYVGACQADVSVLFHNLPFLEFLHTLFTGTPDCSQVDWSLLGLSMAAYSSLYFTFLILMHIITAIISFKHRNQLGQVNE